MEPKSFCESESISSLPRLITRQTIAEWLGCSLRQVDIFRREHHLPYIKLGHSIRFELEAVKAWLKSRYKSGTCEMILE